MARSCTICIHAEVEAIHKALGAGAEGLSLNAAAAQFRVPASTLKRHVREHRGPAPSSNETPSSPDPAPLRTPHAHPMRTLGGHAGQGGRACEVCRHPRRSEMETLIIEGGALLAVEQAFPDSPSRRSLRRHRDGCMRALLDARSERITEGIAGQARAKCVELVERLERLVNKLEKAAEREKLDGSEFNNFLRVVREFRPAVELLGKLTGEIRPDLSVGVILGSPDFSRVLTVLLDAVRPYGPEALEAVATAIDGLDAGGSPPAGAHP